MKKEDAAAEGDRASVKTYTTEMTKTLNEGIESLFERFPDMHPAHERRQIEKRFGLNAVTAYVQALRTKVSSDAGRMQTAFLRNAGTLGMLESKAAGRKVLSIFDILGKKRKDMAFHLWGGSSSGGREQCDKLITERMDDWKKEQVDRWETLTPIETSREISNEALKVVCDIRKELFEDLPTKTQAFWEEKAKHLHLPQTDEEKQCLVDAFLPALFRLLTHLSKHTSLHFLLFASGQGTSNVPVLAHEFSQSTDEQLSFLDEYATLGQRIRSDYLQYALDRHNTGQEEVVEGLPVMHTPDDSHTEVQNDPGPKQSKNPQRGRTPISPFQPNPSTVKSRSQRITYLSKWFMDAGARIVGYKITWDLFCKNVRKYVLTERMPMDPLVEGKRLEIQRPNAMEDPRFDAWWKFMLQSYDGTLNDEQRFMFQGEAVHQNIPAPPAPAEGSAHQAAINATKTIPMKKAPAKGGSKKGRKAIKESAFAEADGFLDAAGIAEDEDAAMLEMALDDQRKPAIRKRSKRPLRVESPEAVTAESPSPEESPGVPAHEEPAAPNGYPPGFVDPRLRDADPSRNPLEAPEDSEEEDAQSARVTDGKPRAQSKRRPRPRGELNPKKETLDHPSFPPKDEAIRKRWQEELVKLSVWGRKMGVGPRTSKVLRFRGAVKKEWVSVLPTGIDAVFSILQMWAACQEGDSPLPRISIPLTGGLTAIDPNHPIALAIKFILSPNQNLPTVKVLNVQFGASPEANNAFFDFVEGTLTALVRQAMQSEQVFLDGAIDVIQVLRLATFVGGTGFIRDLSTHSEHTTRTSALVDQLNVFLASLALVRYHHVVLGGVAEAFCLDQSIEGAEKAMWVLLRDTWTIAVRSMARAVVKRRCDLFDRPHLPKILPEPLDRMVQTSLGLRPWWTHGDEGLPPIVSFTTKRSVATSSFYDTLRLLDWSSITLLERSQYLLLVLLAGVQVHSGRVPSEILPVGVIPGRTKASSPKAIETLTNYLRGFKETIATSTEVGDVDQPLEDRLVLPNVRHAIDRWEAESLNPGVIQIHVDEDDVMSDVQDAGEVPSPVSLGSSTAASGKDELNQQEPSIDPGNIPGGSSPEGAANPTLHPDVETNATLLLDDASTSSSASKTPYEEEDSIWPNAEGPSATRTEKPDSSGPGVRPPGVDTVPAPPVPDRIVPAVRPRSPSPTAAAKGKRRRIVPETPQHWQADHQQSDGRQLRSNRKPPPASHVPATPKAGTTRGRAKLTIIDETQARLNGTKPQRQSTRQKRPAK